MLAFSIQIVLAVSTYLYFMGFVYNILFTYSHTLYMLCLYFAHAGTKRCIHTFQHILTIYDVFPLRTLFLYLRYSFVFLFTLSVSLI